MIAGQAEDMAFEQRTSLTVEECLHMEAGKTAALLSCAAVHRSDPRRRPGSTVDALADFGRHLGIAFQAVDDLLGIWGEPAVDGQAGRQRPAPAQEDPARSPIAMAGGLPEEPRTTAREHDLTDDGGRRGHGAARSSAARGTRRWRSAEANLRRARRARPGAARCHEARAELAAIARYVTERDR